MTAIFAHGFLQLPGASYGFMEHNRVVVAKKGPRSCLAQDFRVYTHYLDPGVAPKLHSFY